MVSSTSEILQLRRRPVLSKEAARQSNKTILPAAGKGKLTPLHSLKRFFCQLFNRRRLRFLPPPAVMSRVLGLKDLRHDKTGRGILSGRDRRPATFLPKTPVTLAIAALMPRLCRNALESQGDRDEKSLS